MDRNELVEKAATVLEARSENDDYEWCLGDAAAVLDAILPDVIEAVKKGSLPAGAEWFPDAGGIQWQGEVYYPADYVLTRLDIQAIRRAALEEAARIGNCVLASSLQDGGEDYDTGFSDAVGAFVAAIRAAVLGDALKGGK